MTTEMFWITTTAIALAVAAYLSWPLLAPKATEAAPSVPSELERLLAEKDTLYGAIKELQFDHAAGNLSDRDYQELRDQYEARALAVLHLLDELSQRFQASQNITAEESIVDSASVASVLDKEGWESVIEREVAAIRAARSGRGDSSSGGNETVRGATAAGVDLG